jgi:endoglucanase
MLKQVAVAAAKQDMLIVLAAGRLTPTSWPGEGLWYSREIPESVLLQQWTKLADALCGQWNVVAVDLHHEPHKATWGQGPANKRWDLAATRLGNHVLSRCPRWLIFVEGIHHGAPNDGGAAKGYWWGENLVGAAQSPVSLTDPTKLVYSPHIEGPNSYKHAYFKDRAFPTNMPRVWKDHFLEVKASSGVPFVIGKMGGQLTDTAETQWQQKAVDYFPSQDISVF